MAAMFSPVRAARVSEDVVEQIKEAIFSGRLLPGDKLSSERELEREFGVSRVTVREAIRTLEGAGLIQVKLGINGGAFVTQATPKIVADSLTTLLKRRTITLLQLSEARKVVETAIVEMAALRADEDDLADMELAIEHTRQAIIQGDSYAAASVEFHAALAMAAKNPVLLSTVDSFRAPLNDALGKLGVIREMPLLALEDHRKILELIRRRDGIAARRLMEIHLQKFEDRLQKIVDEENN